MTVKLPPLFISLRGYQRSWLRGDLIAALTVWAVLVPESLAYASIAGVSPVVGLYAAPGALILYAAFGSSRHLVTGPMSATAALSAAIVADVAVGGDADAYTQLTASLAVATGIAAVVFGLLRLGFIANFISEPVLKGFIIGLALTIMIGQVPKLLGIEGGSGNFFEKAWAVIKGLDDIDGPTLAVGALSLVIVLVLKRVAPVVPASLVAVAVGVLAVKLFDLADEGVSIVGHIDSGLPSLGLPDAPRADWLSLAGSCVGVVLIGFAEGLGAAKTYATREGYEIDANRELLGLGTANLASGFSSGMVVNGSLSKTAVNGAAGAKTQAAGLIVAGLTIVTLLFLTGLFEDLPEATLAAVVIAAVVELVDIDALRELHRFGSEALGEMYGVFSRPDYIAAVAALFGVLLFDTLPGLVIGVAVSMALLIYRVSKPNIARLGRVDGREGRWVDVSRQPDAAQAPSIVVLRPEAGLFFANADAVRRFVLDSIDGSTTGVVLDGESMPFIDVTAARELHKLSVELGQRGIRLVLARNVGQVRDLLDVDQVEERVEEQVEVYGTVESAVKALERSSGQPT
jgi:high affinity sulfate transporter 1